MPGFNIGYAEISEAWGDLSGKSKKKKKQQDPICDLYETKGSSSAYSEIDLINYSYDKNKYQRTVRDKPKELNFESKQLPNSLFEQQFDVKHPQQFDLDSSEQDRYEKSCDSTVEHKRSDDRQDYKRQPSTEQEYEYEPKQDYKSTKQSRQPSTEQEYEYEPRQEYIYQEKEQYDTDSSEQERYYSRQKRNSSRQESPRQERRNYYTSDEYDSDDYIERPKRHKKQKFVYLDILLYVLSGIILIFLLEQFVKIGINMQHV
jgi:hypothetical protein